MRKNNNHKALLCLSLLLVEASSAPINNVDIKHNVTFKTTCNVDANGNSVCEAKEVMMNRNSEGEEEASNVDAHYIPCGVYMAPSTLGEDTNLGIYTGIDLPADSVINYPEIAIPLMFREWDGHPFGDDILDGQLWDRYIWEGEVADIETYIDTNRIMSRAIFVPGVGCTINGIMDINNIESCHGSVYDTAGLNRYEDPGSGAFTPYHSSISTTIEDIPAGSEIFASYGDTWIPSIPGAQITLEEYMLQGEEFLRDTYYPFIKNKKLMPKKASDDKVEQAKNQLTEGLYNFTKSFPYYSKAFTNLPRHVPFQDVYIFIESTQEQYLKDEPNEHYNVLDDDEDDEYDEDIEDNDDDDDDDDDDQEEKMKKQSNIMMNKEEEQMTKQHNDLMMTKDVWKIAKEKLKKNKKRQEDELLPMHRREYSVIRHFIRRQHMRKIDWLQKNGKCQDHIKPAISTLPQAGRGAFATRDLPKGTVVGYSPLIHIATHVTELLNITHIHDDLLRHNGYNYFDELVFFYKQMKKQEKIEAGELNEEDEDDEDYEEIDAEEDNEYNQIWDLIINYSFGHKDSSLLLTPYGGMVNYINHHSKLANVKVQWPTRELIAHKMDWLTNKDITQFSNTIDKIGLSFDYVALRDIKEGEEIFMDYGPEWEKAWDDHVANWKPFYPDIDKFETYKHSSEFIKSITYYKTISEQEEEPYPDNIITMCQKSYRKVDDYYVWLPVLRNSPHRMYCNIVDRTKNEKTGKYFYSVELLLEHPYKVLDDEDEEDEEDALDFTEDMEAIANEECEDLEDEDDYEECMRESLQRLAMEKNKKKGKKAQKPPKRLRSIIVQNVPQKSIFLYDKAKSADWHLPNAFRHRIAIPDDIMPEIWKNLKQ